MKCAWTIGLVGLAGLSLALPVHAQYRLPKLGEGSALRSDARPKQLEGVAVTEKLESQVDLNLTFTAENGYPVKLGEFFRKDRPVILNLVYYTCPMLCTMVLNGQVEALRGIPWTPGQEYEIVTISVDPRDSFAEAKKKKDIYLASFDRPAPGWHFLADHDGNVAKLAEQVGFGYKYDSRIEQYAHPAAIMVLTPEGRVARYLYGIKYSPRDVRFALAEATKGRVTMALEKILLFCYHYDPKASGYVLFAQNIMRAGGIATVLAIVLFLRFMFKAERARMERYAKEGLA